MIHEDHRLLEGSKLYREFLTERAEILRHKWIESEKAGQDIGFDKALLGWLINHRNAWRANRQTSPLIEAAFWLPFCVARR